eukprot:scaffold5382_cov405-Prasinococcus_capsulatus_cf.AAC.5
MRGTSAYVPCARPGPLTPRLEPPLLKRARSCPSRERWCRLPTSRSPVSLTGGTSKVLQSLREPLSETPTNVLSEGDLPSVGYHTDLTPEEWPSHQRNFITKAIERSAGKFSAADVLSSPSGQQYKARTNRLFGPCRSEEADLTDWVGSQVFQYLKDSSDWQDWINYILNRKLWSTKSAQYSVLMTSMFFILIVCALAYSAFTELDIDTALWRTLGFLLDTVSRLASQHTASGAEGGQFEEEDILVGRNVGFIVTLIGLIFVSSFIGLISSGIAEKVSEIDSGISVIMEANHIVVCHWTTQVIRAPGTSLECASFCCHIHAKLQRMMLLGQGISLLQEMLTAHERLLGTGQEMTVVILAKDRRAEVLPFLESALGPTLMQRVIYREGDPTQIADLYAAGIHRAFGVCVLTSSQNPMISDSVNARTALQIGRVDPGASVVVELYREDNASSFIGLHPGFEYVQMPSVSAQILVRFLQGDVSGRVARELLSSDGQEFHLKPCTGLSGQYYGSCFDAHTDCIPVGIRRTKGEETTLYFNPPDKLRIRRDDSLLILSYSTSVAQVDLKNSGHVYRRERAAWRKKNTMAAQPSEVEGLFDNPLMQGADRLYNAVASVARSLAEAPFSREEINAKRNPYTKRLHCTWLVCGWKSGMGMGLELRRVCRTVSPRALISVSCAIRRHHSLFGRDSWSGCNRLFHEQCPTGDPRPHIGRRRGSAGTRQKLAYSVRRRMLQAGSARHELKHYAPALRHILGTHASRTCFKALPNVQFSGAIVLSTPNERKSREVADADALLQVNLLRSVLRERGLHNVTYLSDYDEADTTEDEEIFARKNTDDPIISIGEITRTLCVQV